MWVLKSDGKKQEFDSNKLVQSCAAAGVDIRVALEIAKKVKGNLKDGESTVEIKREVYHLLMRSDPEAARRYISYKKVGR